MKVRRIRGDIKLSPRYDLRAAHGEEGGGFCELWSSTLAGGREQRWNLGL